MSFQTQSVRRRKNGIKLSLAHMRRWCCYGLLAVMVVMYMVVILQWVTNKQRLQPDAHRVFLDRSQQTPWSPPVAPQWGLEHLQKAKNSPERVSSGGTRYLIYRPPLEAAQGVGNLMNGLLAAHLLGIEFDRVVCVAPDWQDFNLAFQSLDTQCQNLFQPKTRTTLWNLNFGKLPVNECQLQKRLASEESVLFYVANCYPHPWPTTSYPDFQQYYRPRKGLLETIPWSVDQPPPPTVVHLRQPDREEVDHRGGLDSNSLQALGDSLPSDTFLVTNQVTYYDFFQTNFKWLHPPWKNVQHSAQVRTSWSRPATNSKHLQTLQLWSDWWTLYKAERVYHTHSDFSGSATRWSRGESYEIRGVDAQDQLMLEKAEWWQKGTLVKAFSQRQDLQHCDLNPSGLDGLEYAFDLDDGFHDDLQDGR